MCIEHLTELACPLPVSLSQLLVVLWSHFHAPDSHLYDVKRKKNALIYSGVIQVSCVKINDVIFAHSNELRDMVADIWAIGQSFNNTRGNYQMIQVGSTGNTRWCIEPRHHHSSWSHHPFRQSHRQASKTHASCPYSSSHRSLSVVSIRFLPESRYQYRRLTWCASYAAARSSNGPCVLFYCACHFSCYKALCN